MDYNAAFVLNAMEINLCMRMAGRTNWSDIQPVESQEPVEHRMIESFLHICTLGFLTPEGDGWRQTELLSSLFGPIANPDEPLLLLDVGPRLRLYRRETDCAVLAQLPTEPESCRVLRLTCLQAAECLLDFARENMSVPLLKSDDAEAESGFLLLLNRDGRITDRYVLRKNESELVADGERETDITVSVPWLVTRIQG